jgi:hypothetical protein
MIHAVYAALRAMRPPFVLYEYDIHQMVEARLRETGLRPVHEARIGPGCRIDYLVDRVGIEIKKGKPIPAVLLGQLKRYAACEAVDGLIVVTQRSVALPASVGGKPVLSLVLAQLWGVALP